MTLTAEGRAIAAEVEALDAALGKRLYALFQKIGQMEKTYDAIVDDALTDSMARAEPQGNVLAWRGGGN